jgi:ABC-type multidrug transport system ATPase subunit
MGATSDSTSKRWASCPSASAAVSAAWRSSRAGPLRRGRGGGAEAVAGQQVAERDADRDSGKQGEDGHAPSIRRPPTAPLGDTRVKADTIGIVQAAIEARAVSHRTRAGEVAVRDVSLTVGHGDLVAIIGGRGSGKTTLLNAMSGLRPPTSGTIVRAARPASYVPDGDTLPAALPLARALGYTARLRPSRAVADPETPAGRAPGDGAPADGYPAAVAEALDQAGLTALALMPAGVLTRGDRKRAAIAAELLSRPAQLFLEEPTAALDPAQGAEVLRLLRRLADGGITVVLTTSSPLDAARCDKVVVLAAGGHLAFYGTPAAALGYFGADSLQEIFERLAGLGDPAAAWSRRFFHFSRTRGDFTVAPATAPPPGPAALLPDAAGPHSAGRVSVDLAAAAVAVDEDPAADAADAADTADAAPPEPLPSPEPGPASPVRQWAVLAGRDAEVLVRNRYLQARLAGAPAAVLLAFCVLLGAGALDGAAAVTLAWAVLGGLVTGLAVQLPDRAAETGILRRERFSGLRTSAFAAAKATVLLPALALTAVAILAVPAIAGRLPGGFGPAYLAVLVSSAVGLAIALAVTAVAAYRAA